MATTAAGQSSRWWRFCSMEHECRMYIGATIALPMQADYSVELGADDSILAVPWSSPTVNHRFIDLRRFPERLGEIPEARKLPALAEFLTAVNSQKSVLQTAKCDAWFSTEISEEEAIFGASCKFGSYVDVVFVSSSTRTSFPDHERFAEGLANLLARAPEIPAALEAVVRRAHFEVDKPDLFVEEGFYFTLYVFGYGDEQEDAQRFWAIAMRLVGNAILQLSAGKPPGS